MRVVLAPEGSRGDVQPMAVLGEALAGRGCDVVVFASPDARELVESRGLGFAPTPLDARAYLTEHAGDLLRPLRFQRAAARYFRSAIPQQFHGLLEVARGADRIVGAGVQFGGPSVAEALGVPYRFVAYVPSVLPSQEHPPFVFERQTTPAWLNRGAWGAFLRLFSVLLRRPLNRERAALGLSPLGDVFQYLTSPELILAAEPELAPLPADAPCPVRQTGFLHAGDAAEPLPAKLEAFLEAGPPPLYLGFGSMTDTDPAGTTRHLLDAVGAVGCRALVSEGWAGLGAGPLPEHVLTVGPVPHGALFPRVAAVVHHGGAGTTQTAARAGVPQVLVPHILDQFYFAHRVERLGLGPPAVRRRDLDAERLAGLLAETVENELVAERARELGETLRARDPVTATADAVLA